MLVEILKDIYCLENLVRVIIQRTYTSYLGYTLKNILRKVTNQLGCQRNSSLINY